MLEKSMIKNVAYNQLDKELIMGEKITLSDFVTYNNL
jgi:hypothetical protein